MEVDLEHGMQFKDANVTNNHPLLTGLIVLAQGGFKIESRICGTANVSLQQNTTISRSENL